MHTVSVVGGKTPKRDVLLNWKKCHIMLDTCAIVNILDEDTYTKVGKPKLSNNRLPRLHPYGGGKPLRIGKV